MLKNERYIGRSVWKKRMWVTDPATGARTYRMRGEDEWVTTEQPQIAIVTKDLWDRVQARFAERKGAKGRARGTGSTGHLLTGLLRCGECGSTMRVVSLKRKAGRAYANFGCSAHHGKGAAICGNGLVISERKLNRAVIDELQKLLASKEIQARFVEGFTKRLQHKNPHDDRERAALEAEVTAQESRVRNVTAAIARSGFSEALAEQLGLEEETLRSLRQRVAAKTPAGERPAAVADPDAVARFLDKVLDIAESAPKRAGVSLSRILVPITLLVPMHDRDGTRRYEARGARNTNPAVLSDGRAGSADDGCGGLQPLSESPAPGRSRSSSVARAVWCEVHARMRHVLRVEEVPLVPQHPAPSGELSVDHADGHLSRDDTLAPGPRPRTRTRRGPPRRPRPPLRAASRGPGDHRRARGYPRAVPRLVEPLSRVSSTSEAEAEVARRVGTTPTTVNSTGPGRRNRTEH